MLVITLRRTADGVYLVARLSEGRWQIEITNVVREPVNEAERRRALLNLLDEISTLRGHIWHAELGHPMEEQKT